MTIMRCVLALFLALSCCVAAVAHHSPVVFDRTREVKLVGVVKEFRWSNPHSFIELEVRNEKGQAELWAVEMNPPSYLVKAGWKSSTIKPGQTVTIMINPLRTPEKAGKFVSLTMEDGKVLTETPLPTAP